MRSNDIPITKAEEEQFYGVPVTEHDINCAVRDQLQALDADDCAEIASEFSKEILAAMWDKKQEQIGVIMIEGLRALAEARAYRVLGLKVKA
jgi:hypothetical protein